MSAQGAFAFPPPPPAPPQAAVSSYHSQGPPTFQRGGHGGQIHRGNRPPHGRGRGEGNRGSRGGYRAQSNASNFPKYPPREQHYNAAIQSNGYPPQTSSRASSSYPLPEYPPLQMPQYSMQMQNGFSYGQSSTIASAIGHPPQSSQVYPVSSQPYSSPSFTSIPYNSRQHHGQYSSPEPQGHNQQQQQTHNAHGQPILMGPPIRMGFDQNLHGDYPGTQLPNSTFQHPASVGPGYSANGNSHEDPAHFRANSRGDHQPNSRGSPNPFSSGRGRGQKRGHSEAFGKQWNPVRRAVAPTAVPSFGFPLPVKVIQDEGKNRKKKKRRHNQLGLTPRKEEHESSEEETLDEEAQLSASLGGVNTTQLQITYRGRTATLQSSQDILAWMEERRKRYPTKARTEAKLKRRAEEIAEQKKKQREARVVVDKPKKDCSKRNKKKKIKVEEKADSKESDTKTERDIKNGDHDTESGNARVKAERKRNPSEAASKAKIRAERLRKQLAKEEMRIARAEAEAEAEATKGEKAPDSALQIEDIAVEMKESRKRKREGSISKETVISANNDGAKDQVNPLIDAGRLVNSTITISESSSEPSQSDGLRHLQQDVSESLSDLITLPTPPVEPDPSIVASMQLEEQPAAPSEPSLTDSFTIGSTENAETDSAETDDHDHDDDSMSLSSFSSSELSPVLEGDEGTSSEGSSSEDDAPDEATLKKNSPLRVPPPKREKPRTICRSFLKSGYCQYGDSCRFRHELPKRGSRNREERKSGLQKTGRVGKKEKRMSLYQKMVEQEKEQEKKLLMQAMKEART